MRGNRGGGDSYFGRLRRGNLCCRTSAPSEYHQHVRLDALKSSVMWTLPYPYSLFCLMVLVCYNSELNF